jgi:hypothetical protein
LSRTPENPETHFPILALGLVGFVVKTNPAEAGS